MMIDRLPGVMKRGWVLGLAIIACFISSDVLAQSPIILSTGLETSSSRSRSGYSTTIVPLAGRGPGGFSSGPGDGWVRRSDRTAKTGQWVQRGVDGAQVGSVAPLAPLTLSGVIEQPPPRAAGLLEGRTTVADVSSVLTGLPLQLPLGHAIVEPLQPFGYEFFESEGAPMEKTGSMSVSGDYRIGPGDVLTVHVWNRLTDEHFAVEVNRDGRIAVPRVGELFVLGLEYGSLSGFLKKEISRYLTDVNVSVVLARLRTFQVLVTGEVKRPGMVNVSAVNTALDALLASGGPSSRGSLRGVVLRRGGKSVAEVDYYELLLSGKRGSDPRLQTGDVLFVPVIGKTAAIAGMIKRPAIYELRAGDSLDTLVGYAGGLSPAAYPKRIILFRTNKSGERRIQDVRLDGNWKERASSLKLQDGDVVQVPRITTVIKNGLTLRGNVERPGQYQWRQGMRLRELIRMGHDLKPGTLMSRVEILRVRKVPQGMEFNRGIKTETIRELLTVHLGRALKGEGGSNVPLAPLDDVNVLSIRDAGPVPQVTISGQIKRPGDYELASGMRVKDLVFMAGNVAAGAHVGRAELVRRKQGGGYKVRAIDLRLALLGDRAHDVLLENFDRLAVHTDPDLTERIEVDLSGEVRYPGKYLVRKGARLSDAVTRAGGFTEEAFLPGAVFRRQSVFLRQEEQKRRFIQEQRKIIAGEKAAATRLPDGSVPLVNPDAFLAEAEELLSRLEQSPAAGRLSLKISPLDSLRGTTEDVFLEGGDRLRVPRPPSEVSVAGEVFSPSSFLFHPNGTVGDYLGLAGGYTSRAWADQTFVIRADGSTVSASQRRRDRTGWDGLHLGAPRQDQSFQEMAVQQGDAIFVPSDYRIKRDRVSEIIDRTYKLAITLGALSGIL